MYRLSGWSDVCVEKEKTQDFVRFFTFPVTGFHTPGSFSAFLRCRVSLEGPRRGTLGKAVCLSLISVHSRHPGRLRIASLWRSHQRNAQTRCEHAAGRFGRSRKTFMRSTAWRELCSATSKNRGNKRKGGRSQQAASVSEIPVTQDAPVRFATVGAPPARLLFLSTRSEPMAAKGRRRSVSGSRRPAPPCSCIS